MSKQEPIRVAQIMGKWLGGGVESVVMNYYRHIDRSKIQFDFICDEDSTNIPYEEIEKLGGEVILIPPYQKVFEYHKELKKVLKDGNYKIVHSHINTLSVFSLFAAKCAGVLVRIAHSHSTTNKQEKKKNLVKQVLRPFSKVFATDYMACTEHACRWLFGNKVYGNGNVYLLNNAIDLDKFKYDEKLRKEKRKELEIPESTFIIGHVGRFVEQKNHDFIIDIFNKYQKKNSDSLLVLIGQGPLENEMKKKLEYYNISNKVLFLGQRDNISDYYNIFDFFLFPSLYEGLGMVLIEAQVNGLNCLASTEVPKIAKINPNVEFLSLDDESDKWVTTISNMKKNYNRKINENFFTEAGYDINAESIKLQEKYLSFVVNNHIELFGIPGSGKSTYLKSNELKCHNLNEMFINDSRIKRFIKKMKYTLKVLFFYRDDNKNLYRFFKLFEFPTFKLKLKMFIYLYSTVYLIMSNEHTRFCLEEGIFQVLWAFFYNTTNEFYDINYCIKQLECYLPKKVIYLDAKEGDVYTRLLERSQKGGSELEHDIKLNNNCVLKAKKIECDIVKTIKSMTEIQVMKL